MTDTPDGELGFVKGFAACAAFVIALIVYLRKGLGVFRNGNGNREKEFDERLKRLESRLHDEDLRENFRRYFLDEIERRRKLEE